MLNSRELRAQLVRRGVDMQTFAAAMGWSLSTAYRKVNGEAAFTVPEVAACKDFLQLDFDAAREIFFTPNMS